MSDYQQLSTVPWNAWDPSDTRRKTFAIVGDSSFLFLVTNPSGWFGLGFGLSTFEWRNSKWQQHMSAILHLLFNMISITPLISKTLPLTRKISRSGHHPLKYSFVGGCFIFHIGGIYAKVVAVSMEDSLAFSFLFRERQQPNRDMIGSKSF